MSERCTCGRSPGKRHYFDCPLAAETDGQARADVVLTEAERAALWMAMADDVTGAQERMIYAAVERIIAARIATLDGER